MADDPTINGVTVLTEEATQRNGAALPAAAQAQLVGLVTVTADGQVTDLDLRTLATSAKQDTANTTLASLLTELGQKLEPADLAALATAAKQDTGNTSLAGIAAALAGVLSVREAGVYGYAAGAAAATVDVPTGARIKRVTVLAGSGGSATVSILGGATITVPAGASFDELVPGDAIAGAGGDVAIAGTVQAYYVSWVA